MDGDRFDQLARALAARRTRRGLLAGIAAVAVGRAAPAAVRAACPPDQVMRRGLGCVCTTTGRPPTDAGCPCPNGQVRCGAACADLASDPAHCGACGAACPADPSVAELVCRRGTCQVQSCAPGRANCDGDLGCETTLGTDTDCGACGDACAGIGVTCGGGGTAGVCGCTDDGQACGTAVCGEATTNCGEIVSCGSCPVGHACESGACVCTAAACFAGALESGDPTFDWCPNQLTAYYDAYPVAHPGGLLQVAMLGRSSGSGTLAAPLIQLYAGGFDPADPCTNRIAFAFQTCAGSWDAYLERDLDPGDYVVVATTAYTYLIEPGSGTYTLLLGVPAPC